MAGPVVDLRSIVRGKSSTEMHEALSAGGACASSCGSNAGQDSVPTEIWERIKDHPCYSEDAHHFFARMHVAVAPACNIQCNYCNRKYDCSNESRPGVVSERLSPDQAVRKVMAAAAQLPQLSVIGIAGPGDALADYRNTFETFRQLSEALPDLTLCLSTNGLALPDHIDTIKSFNIGHVTVTVNAIDPEIGAKIYAWVFYDHKRWTGVEGARILIERQLEGIKMLSDAGVLVKVNSVLIPGINDHHLEAVNAEVRARGAFLHNVMPLISDPAHGTHFGLTGQRGPNPMELKAVQDKLGSDANLMKHCRQCRADAVGMLGEDQGEDFALDKLPEVSTVDHEKRRAYREIVERDRSDKRRAADEAQQEIRALAPDEPMLIAVTTKGGGRINQHFGHATEFQLFELDHSGLRFAGIRRADKYCRGGDGDDDTLDTTIAALEGVSLVLTAKIGHCPREQLAAAGIEVVDDYGFEYVEGAVARYLRKLNAECDIAQSA